ncbi:hypothetical protein B0H11DRAFT_2198139 [Mycena galericulata]|nr:hypothetical protein B0H11DRAFT_2198139 [Mycena galericulata]
MGAFGKMTIIFFATVIGLGVGHHFLNSHLNGRSVTSNILPQSGVQHFNSLLPVTSLFLLTSVLGDSYSQIAWSPVMTAKQRRRRRWPKQEVDWMFGLMMNHWDLIHFRYWRTHWRLVAFAFLGLGLQILPILVPGSLTVQPILTDSHTTCNISTIDLSQISSLYSETTGLANAALERVALYALISGTNQVAYYPCGSNCSYIIAFEGPSLVCNQGIAAVSGMSVWNATQNITPLGTEGILHIEWYPLSTLNSLPPLPPYALDCAATNAVYTVTVSQVQPRALDVQGTLLAQLQLVNTTLDVVPAPTSTAASAPISDTLVNLVFEMLEGSVTVPPNSSESNPSFIAWQTHVTLWAAATNSSTGQFLSFDDAAALDRAVTQLMQDTVLNIASLQLSPRQVYCTKTGLTNVFVYNVQLLVIPYACAVGLVFIAGLMAFLEVREMGKVLDQQCSTILTELQLDGPTAGLKNTHCDGFLPGEFRQLYFAFHPAPGLRFARDSYPVYRIILITQ